MHSFYEWTDTSGEVQKRFPAAQEVDTYPTFKTEYVESGFGDQFKFSIGDINDPDEYWVDASFDPNASQIMGETHSKADQLPGEPDDKESFDDMRYRLNSTWYDYYGTDVLTDPKIHDRDEVSAANHLHIWDLCE